MNAPFGALKGLFFRGELAVRFREIGIPQLFRRHCSDPSCMGHLDLAELWCWGILKITDVSWVVVSNIFYFHPYLGKWSNFDSYFSDGLKPPTSFWGKTKSKGMNDHHVMTISDLLPGDVKFWGYRWSFFSQLTTWDIPTWKGLRKQPTRADGKSVSVWVRHIVWGVNTPSHHPSPSHYCQ